jgi:HPt (histidine-containing phosphotransfer) domain-containing protein
MPHRQSTAQAPATPVVDGAALSLDAASLQRLRELDPNGDNRVIERVLSAFEGSLKRLLAQAADAPDDPATIRHVAHTLKSSSASVGALELSRRCAEIENRLRVAHLDELPLLLRGMHVEGQRVLVSVRAMLGS